MHEKLIRARELLVEALRRYSVADGGIDLELAILALHTGLHEAMQAYLISQGYDEIDYRYIGYNDLVDWTRDHTDLFEGDERVPALLFSLNTTRLKIAHPRGDKPSQSKMVKDTRQMAQLICRLWPRFFGETCPVSLQEKAASKPFQRALAGIGRLFIRRPGKQMLKSERVAVSPQAVLPREPEHAVVPSQDLSALEPRQADLAPAESWMNSSGLPEGVVLGNRYRVIRPLRKGGMGAAYLVEDERLGRQHVAKASTLHDAAHREQFEREARMLAALSHPNLPEVYDYFFDMDRPYLIMQYIEGATLDWLREDRSVPFKVGQVLRWADDLLGALIYLHSQDPPIIHRDIKPSNICITPEGKAVLLDFGIARQLDETRTRTGAQAHSIHYAPIEQYPPEVVGSYGTLQQYLEELKAAGIHTGPYSDIYSLGATLYFALTLRDPVDACFRLLGEKLRPAHEFNSDIPDSLAEALNRALAIDPRGRCQSAIELRRLLRQ